MAEDDRDRERELTDERGKEIEQELERVGQLDDEDDESPEEKLQKNEDEDETQVDPTGGSGGDSDI